MEYFVTKSLQDKKGPALKFSQRDKELIYWANGLGFINTELVTKKWNVSREVATRRLRRLYQVGLFRRTKIFWNSGYLHIPTQQALDLIDDDMPPIRDVSLGMYNHNYALAEVSIELEKTGARFVPERRHRRFLNKKKKGIGIKGHVPDGLYYASEEAKPIAIEIELSKKNPRRIKKIAEYYSMSFDYDEVRYFTNNKQVKTLLEKAYADDDNVTIEEREFGGCY